MLLFAITIAGMIVTGITCTIMNACGVTDWRMLLGAIPGVVVSVVLYRMTK